jgi:hypothetical protein
MLLFGLGGIAMSSFIAFGLDSSFPLFAPALYGALGLLFLGLLTAILDQFGCLPKIFWATEDKVKHRIQPDEVQAE